MTLQAARLNKMLGVDVFTAAGVAVDDTVCADTTGLTVDELARAFIFQSRNNFKEAAASFKASGGLMSIEWMVRND